MANIKERIIEFIEFKKIKKEDFYKKIGVNGSNFRSVALQSELSGDKIAKILAEFPELSPDWLLLEKGEMIRPEGQNAAGNTADREKIIALQDEIIALQREVNDLLREKSSPAVKPTLKQG